MMSDLAKLVDDVRDTLGDLDGVEICHFKLTVVASIHVRIKDGQISKVRYPVYETQEALQLRYPGVEFEFSNSLA